MMEDFRNVILEKQEIRNSNGLVKFKLSHASSRQLPRTALPQNLSRCDEFAVVSMAELDSHG